MNGPCLPRRSWRGVFITSLGLISPLSASEASLVPDRFARLRGALGQVKELQMAAQYLIPLRRCLGAALTTGFVLSGARVGRCAGRLHRGRVHGHL